jgi:hypothetical protein
VDKEVPGKEPRSALVDKSKPPELRKEDKGPPRPAPDPATTFKKVFREKGQVGGALAAALLGPVQALPVLSLVELPPRRVELDKNLWLETSDGVKRILVGAEVCLREGEYGLECLLCRSLTKEHESILKTDVAAWKIHAALVAIGAKPGTPTDYFPRFKPPTGATVKIHLQYEDEGKTVTVPAGYWIRDTKAQKDLDLDWVFGGSRFYKNVLDENKQEYAADLEGAYIAVANVPTAMLDLPVRSPKGLEERAYGPHTKRIPAEGTKVLVILEPVPEKE